MYVITIAIEKKTIASKLLKLNIKSGTYGSNDEFFKIFKKFGSKISATTGITKLRPKDSKTEEIMNIITNK